MITEENLKDLIYEIEYGNLNATVKYFDKRLVAKVLCIYVDKLNDCINSIHEEIIEEIEDIDLEELNEQNI